MNITLNDQQRVFVLKEGDHVSCLGYEVVFDLCREMVRRIRKILFYKGPLPDLSDLEIGSAKQYGQYQELLRIIGSQKTGTWFHFKTPVKIRNLLEKCRKENTTVRLFCGDTKTGRCWMNEYGVIGKIGRSCGVMQVPLLIEAGEIGGVAIADVQILRVIDVHTGSELYRHRLYHMPEMEIRPVHDQENWTHIVWIKGTDDVFVRTAGFESYGMAAHWVAFMCGNCMEPPV